MSKKRIVTIIAVCLLVINVFMLFIEPRPDDKSLICNIIREVFLAINVVGWLLVYAVGTAIASIVPKSPGHMGSEFALAFFIFMVTVYVINVVFYSFYHYSLLNICKRIEKKNIKYVVILGTILLLSILSLLSFIFHKVW